MCMSPMMSMSEELKTERVITLMSAAEVKAVDDWSFANRIRSRGEAMRRLIQLGLEAAKRESRRRSKTREPEKKR
jgi:hypothetical protein